MVKEIGAHLRDTMGLFRHFTHVTYSCELHVVKPEPAIYHHVLRGLAAAPHEALFVDDRLPNIEAARALGLHAHLYRGREGLVGEVEERYELRGAE
jgi:putative hydrolase of the HAD superfamily